MSTSGSGGVKRKVKASPENEVICVCVCCLDYFYVVG